MTGLPMDTRQRVMLGAGVLGLIVVASLAYRSFYAVPRYALATERDDLRAKIAEAEHALEGSSKLRERQAAVRGTLLASKPDVLAARLRDGLVRLGEAAGLADVVVEQGPPQAQTSVLVNVKGVPSDLKRDLRKTPDFQVVRGGLRGTGTLSQAVAALASAQSQPWIHRVEGFSIKPVGKSRERVEVRIDVATAHAPELAGKDLPEPTLAPTPPEVLALVEDAARRNAFRTPDPASDGGGSAVRVVSADAPPAGQAFAPYGDWRLTGIASGSTGPQAFFVNVKTGARLTVRQGGAVLDAIFVEGAGERAVIEIGGHRFEVSNGDTLAARKPVG